MHILCFAVHLESKYTSQMFAAPNICTGFLMLSTHFTVLAPSDLQFC